MNKKAMGLLLLLGLSVTAVACGNTSSDTTAPSDTTSPAETPLESPAETPLETPATSPSP